MDSAGREIGFLKTVVRADDKVKLSLEVADSKRINDLAIMLVQMKLNPEYFVPSELGGASRQNRFDPNEQPSYKCTLSFGTEMTSSKEATIADLATGKLTEKVVFNYKFDCSLDSALVDFFKTMLLGYVDVRVTDHQLSKFEFGLGRLYLKQSLRQTREVTQQVYFVSLFDPEMRQEIG